MAAWKPGARAGEGKSTDCAGLCSRMRAQGGRLAKRAAPATFTTSPAAWQSGPLP